MTSSPPISALPAGPAQSGESCTKMLSAHFTEREMACHHCGRLPAEMAGMQVLLASLEHLRAIAGAAIRVNDAYRCPEHNEEVGGVQHSQHELGRAADIVIESCPDDFAAMYRLAVQVPLFALGGIGVYSSPPRLHVDVRPDGPARWAVRDGERQEPLSVLIPG